MIDHATNVEIAQKVLRVLTLVTAGLAALVFPVMLFAIQGLGEIDVEAVLFLLSFYLTHPVSIALIFLVSFGKIASGRGTNVATGIVGLNVLLLLAIAAIVQAGAFTGDSFVPLVVAVPSILFLLNCYIGSFRGQ